MVCFDWGWTLVGWCFMSSALGAARWGWGSLGCILILTLSGLTVDYGWTQVHSNTESYHVSKDQSKSSKEQIVAQGSYKNQRFTISLNELKTYVALHQETRPVHEYLNELIETEILKIEALQQGLAAHPQVRLAQKRLLVQKMIRHELQSKIRPETIDAHYVEQATRSNLGLFRHPQLRRASHVIVKPKGDSKDPINEQDKTILIPLIQRIQKDLKTHPPEDVVAFQRRAIGYQEWMPEGYEARFEVLKRFSRKGPYVPSFTEACFKIEKPNQITPIVETQYGYHLAWVTEVLDAKDTPDEEIEKEVRRRLVPEIQGFEFKRLFTRLQNQYPVRWLTLPSLGSPPSPQSN